jgi:hypothetical protein
MNREWQFPDTRASGQMSEAARFVLTLIRKNHGEWF